MFSSKNNHKNDLNLFYYKDHICFIKDLNKYFYRSKKIRIKNIFVQDV